MTQSGTLISSPKIDYLFHPRSVAIVGASSSPLRLSNLMFQQPLLASGYSGEIYFISLTEDEIMGRAAYRSILDAPGPVDHVIVIIPASATPQLMKDCAQKGVRLVTFYTAGFGETANQEGLRLQHEILTIAAKAGIRILGPNCLGIYCPETGLSFASDFSNISGSAGLFCQSGGNTLILIDECESRGVHFSKAISYGNASDLNESDLLEYLADDPNTSVIGAYVEGLRDAPRFFDLLKKTAPNKPVIVAKGGMTEAGAQIASSHTASLAGTAGMWEVLSKQTGVILASSMEEIADLLTTFTFLPPIQNNRVGIIATGGGISVFAADSCVRAGLQVPQYSEALKNELRQFMPMAGSIFRNPLDVYTPELYSRVIQVVAQSDEIDFFLIDVDPRIAHPYISRDAYDQQAESIIESLGHSSKPTAVVINPDPRPQLAGDRHELSQRYTRAGLPVYPCIDRAARAIAKFIDYHQHWGVDNSQINAINQNLAPQIGDIL